ncbi:DUF871 family protein [Staphylococcus agnetis]|uniref:MupG family TIM beta-alpha barrel fold protein n=1 Tax=Staphylococcus agnetis TaxID=985762 RepID=UPI001430C50D|nr:MupG family TIM beta-alpha barrel fold protein [Staphylococcus agnetis]NJH86258.1 DUF871 family protein [Staphylococcus agnetis]NJI15074.1 DUF871 family protein [Staphylococcus agnetis]
MLGFSVYLGTPLNENNISQMIALGYDTVFTSLQIPEELHIAPQFEALLSQLSHHDITLIIDTNESNITSQLFSQLAKYPSIEYVIRIDEGTSLSLVNAIIQHAHKCCINASTVSEHFLNIISSHPRIQPHLIYLHNYYPRPDTGLSRSFLQDQNIRIRNYHTDAQILAFIPGETYRAPLYKGLPTLECTRHCHPCLAALTLKALNIDGIIIGDLSVSTRTAQRLVQMIQHNHFILPCHLVNGVDDALILKTHQSRPDCAAHVIRSQFSRQHVDASIPPFNIEPRAKGTITIDNERNGRYMGELQITKINLKPHPHVNVVGTLTKEGLPYLNYFDASTTFTFVLAEEDE